jgi:outer membrane biosynthesis protein TonB
VDTKKEKVDTKKEKVDTKKEKVDTNKEKVDTNKEKVGTKTTKEDTKATTKEKRLNDGKAKPTKSKKSRPCLISLFCCCFKSQARNEEMNEFEPSMAEKNETCFESTSQNSFQSIDLND